MRVRLSGEARAIARMLLPGGGTVPFVAGSAGAAAKAIAQLLIPVVLGSMVDDALLREDSRALAHRSLLLGILALVTFGAHSVQSLAFRWLGERSLATLQGRLLAHVQTRSQVALDGLRGSEIQTVFAEDGPRLASLYGETLGRALFTAVQLGGLLILLGWRYRAEAVLVLVLTPVYLVIPGLLAPKVRRAARDLRAAGAAATARIQELVTATREVKIFGRRDWASRSLVSLFDRRRLGAMKLEAFRSCYWSSYSLTFVVGAAVYWYGGLQVLEGRRTVGELITLVALLTYLESPVGRLASLHAEVQAIRASVDRLKPLLLIPGERPGGTRILARRGGASVEFVEATFWFPDSPRPALANVNFKVPAGARVGVVGPSGAGKSTLVALLLRLYELTGGSILIDERDIGDFELEALRSAVGFVPQDPVLFPGTIWENLTFGNPKARDGDVLACCRLAAVDEFVEGLAHGYESVVGDRAVKLSGGQRQRIAIARALVREPTLLILDEATSGLDPELENRILSRLSAQGSMTTFLVTHRVRTIAQCRPILVLDAGRLIGCGGHDELVRSCQLYGRLSTGTDRPVLGTPRSSPEDVRRRA